MKLKQLPKVSRLQLRLIVGWSPPGYYRPYITSAGAVILSEMRRAWFEWLIGGYWEWRSCDWREGCIRILGFEIALQARWA